MQWHAKLNFFSVLSILVHISIFVSAPVCSAGVFSDRDHYFRSLFGGDECSEALELSGAERQSIRAFRDKFPTIPSMIFHDHFKINRAYSMPFIAGNEYDWYKMAVDHEPTDMVWGYGTNNTWDIAVRKNAKFLIISDWEDEPLIGQEFFFKPIILNAKSPADFFSLLAGVPIPESVNEASLGEVIEYIKEYLSYPSNSRKSKRIEFLKTRLGQMQADPRIGIDHLIFLKRYFNRVLDEKSSAFGLSNEDDFGPFEGRNASFGSMLFSDFFNKRYNPKFLLSAGATKEALNDPYFSSFSSMEAFKRLQKLFDGRVFFVKASINNPLPVVPVKKLMAENHLNDLTVFSTNIFNVMTYDLYQREQVLRQYLNRMVSEFASPRHPLVFYQTVGTMISHEYEIMKFGNPTKIASTLESLGYPVNQLGFAYENDFQKIMKIISKAKPELETSWKSRIEISFGKKIHIGFSEKLISINFASSEGRKTEMALIDNARDDAYLRIQLLKVLKAMSSENAVIRDFIQKYYPDGLGESEDVRPLSPIPFFER